MFTPQCNTSTLLAQSFRLRVTSQRGRSGRQATWLGVFLLMASSGVQAQLDLAQFAPNPQLREYSVYATDSINLPSNSGTANGGFFGSGGGISLSSQTKLRSPYVSAGRSFSLTSVSLPTGNQTPARIHVGQNFLIADRADFKSAVQVGDSLKVSGNDIFFRDSVTANVVRATGDRNFFAGLVQVKSAIGSKPIFQAGSRLNVAPGVTPAYTGTPTLTQNAVYPNPLPMGDPLVQAPSMLPGHTIVGLGASNGKNITAAPVYNSMSGYKFKRNSSGLNDTAIKVWHCDLELGPLYCNGDTLKPGIYGNLNLSDNGVALIVGEGFYGFDQISLGAGSKIVAVQPNGKRTFVYSKGNISASQSGSYLGPIDALDVRNSVTYGAGKGQFYGGTFMLLGGADISIPSDLTVWATISAPRGTVKMGSQVRLYGQVFAQRIFGSNNIDFGEGAYIPFDPQLPTITINHGADVTIVERGPSQTPLTYRDTTLYITLNNANTYDVSVRWTLVDGSADNPTLPKALAVANGASPQNYASVSGTNTGVAVITRGTVSAPVTVRIFDNALFQGDLPFTLRLSDPVNARFSTGLPEDTTIVTIKDDEASPYLSFASSDKTVLENKGKDTLWVQLSSAVQAPVTVTYAVRAGGTAVQNTHFQLATPQSVVIPAGQLRAPLIYTLLDNPLDEANRRFTLQISTISGGIFRGTPDTVRVVIQDDDLPPRLILEPASATEGLAVGVIARLSAVSGVSACFNWSTQAGGTATPNVDYTTTSGTGVCISPGSTTRVLSIPTREDALYENAETFRVTATIRSGITSSGSVLATTGTIVDNDPKPILRISDVDSVRAASGTKVFRFKVQQLDPVTLKPVLSGVNSVANWATSNGSAVAGTDFLAGFGTLTFRAMTDSVLWIPVTTLGDARYHQAPLTFTVGLTVVSSLDGTHAQARMTATGTLRTVASPPRIILMDTLVKEGNSGITPGTMRLRLVDSLGNAIVSRDPVTVQWTTQDGSARTGIDFRGVSLSAPATHVIAAGLLEDTLQIGVLGNTLFQSNRSFSVRIQSMFGASSGTPSDLSNTVTIEDDDAQPVLIFDTISVKRDSVRGSLQTTWLRLRLTDASDPTREVSSGLPVVFRWSTVDSTALAGTDYVGRSNVLDTIKVGNTRDSIAIQVIGDDRFVPVLRFKTEFVSVVGAKQGAPGRIDLVSSLRQPQLRFTGLSAIRGIAGSKVPLPFVAELIDPATGLQATLREPVAFAWGTYVANRAPTISSKGDTLSREARTSEFESIAAELGSIPAGNSSDTVYVNGFGTNSTGPQLWVPSKIEGSSLSSRLVSFADTALRSFATLINPLKPTARFGVGDSMAPENQQPDIVRLPVLLNLRPAVDLSLAISIDPTITTAKRGVNFVLLDSVATFLKDDTVAYVRVRLLPDGVDNDTLLVRFALQANDSVPVSQAYALLRIADVDPPPQLSFDTTILRVPETGGRIAIGVHLNTPSGRLIQGNLQARGGNARAGTDYVINSPSVSFSSGQTRDTVYVTVRNDGQYGPTRDVFLHLSDLDTSKVLRGQDSVLHLVIENTDPLPSMSFQPSTVLVEDRVGSVRIVVGLNVASLLPADVQVAVLEASSQVAFAGDSIVKLDFSPEAVQTGFTLQLRPNGKVGPDYQFRLVLRSPSGAQLGGDSILTVSIRNTNVAPKVVIVRPQDSTKTNQPKQTIDWTWDGFPQVSVDTTLVEGWNRIVRCAQDTAGNVGCDSAFVWADFTPPRVVITRFDSTKIGMSDTAELLTNRANNRIDWLTIDSGATWRDSLGRTLDTTLPEGRHILVRTECDAVGNCGSDTLQVRVDLTGPTVSIQTPPNGSRVTTDKILVEWTSNDDGVLTNHRDTSSVPAWGWNNVVRCAQDAAGNQTCDTARVYRNPPSALSGTYVDTDGDGRIDALIVQGDSPWSGDSLPNFTVTLGGQTRSNLPATGFWQGPAQGTPLRDAENKVVKDANGDTLFVLPGTLVYDSLGNVVRDSLGYPVVMPTGKPLVGDNGLPVRDSLGRALFQVDPSAKTDPTRLVVPIVPPFDYGITSVPKGQQASFEMTLPIRNQDGSTTATVVRDTFTVKDAVAPVIVSAEIRRTEQYDGRDTLFITPSEPVDLSKGKNWLEIQINGQWVKVPTDSVFLDSTGRLWFLLPPGANETPDPGVKIRFGSDVSDSLSNVVDNPKWSVVVQGPPRPPMLEVTPPSTIPRVGSAAQNTNLRSGFALQMSKSGTSNSMEWWKPGVGYVNASEYRDICPETTPCEGVTVVVNRPMDLAVYIYDNLGVSVNFLTLRITQEDLDRIQPDPLDRVRLRLMWNLRGSNNRIVASGIYPWRIVANSKDNQGRPLAAINNVVRMGVNVLGR